MYKHWFMHNKITKLNTINVSWKIDIMYNVHECPWKMNDSMIKMLMLNNKKCKINLL